jgi:hypothetical protein
MDNYEKILVVFLATTLAVTLVLGIILLIKVIKIVNRVNRISEKIESVTDKAASLSELFGRFAGPLAVGKFMSRKFKTKRGK